MPPMGNPHSAFPHAAPTDVIRGVRSDVRSLRVRLRAALYREQLNRALAEGADPAASQELALRARQVTGDRNRRMLARSLRSAIAEAHDPPMVRVRSIIDRRAALDAEAAMMEMVERLSSPAAVQPQGVALLIRILTNADGASPLYNASESGALRRAIRSATAALYVEPARSHEFALAV